MEIEATSADRNLLLEMKGELDHHGARNALRELELSIDAALPKKLVLDLAGVTFMDSSGIALILRAQQRMQLLEGSLLVRNVPQQARRVLDAAGIKTSYKKVDGGYVINGHKIYNTYASCSDYNIITAKDPEIDDPYKAVTLFAIPNPTPGMTIVDLPTIGQWLEPTCETFLEDCFIPDKYLYGKEHGGWVQLMKHFEAERLLCAAMYLGQAETAFADLCAYANSRIQFGQPIGKFQLIQEKVCRDKIILESMRNMVFRTAWEYDQGKSIRIDANICKLLCTEGNWQICDDGIQILGGLGYCTDHRMQRLWRDARVGRIGAGSSEILTKTIAKDVLREAGQYGGGTRALGI